MWNKKTNSNFLHLSVSSGFTYLEILVAMAILGMAITGLFALVTQSIQSYNVNHNYLIASMLAQEGIELVRNIRDENWVSGAANWYDSIYDPVTPTNTYSIEANATGYMIDDTPNSITDPGARLYYGNFYNITGTGDATPFYRLVTVSRPSPEYLEVEVEVRWEERNRSHNYVAYTHIYDWR